MIHQTINCILVVALIVLFLVCCCSGDRDRASPTAETFYNYRLSQSMGPFVSPKDSVNASYPSQRRDNSSWTYATPFQSACTSGPDPSKCTPQNTFTCYLTPKNQRKCVWGQSPPYAL